MIISKKGVVGFLLGTISMLGAMEQVAAAPLHIYADPINWSTTPGNVVVSRPTPPNVPFPAMWSCPVGTECDDLSEGPTNAFFSRSFEIPVGEGLKGGFTMLADDYLEVYINNQFTFAARLEDDNQAPNTDPVPLLFAVDTFDIFLQSGTLLSQGTFDNVFHTGINTIEIQAYDGYFGVQNEIECIYHPIPGTSDVWCEADRGNKYVHVDSEIEFIQEVPEPPALALVLTALGMFGGYRKARTRNK